MKTGLPGFQKLIFLIFAHIGYPFIHGTALRVHGGLCCEKLRTSVFSKRRISKRTEKLISLRERFFLVNTEDNGGVLPASGIENRATGEAQQKLYLIQIKAQDKRDHQDGTSARLAFSGHDMVDVGAVDRGFFHEIGRDHAPLFEQMIQVVRKPVIVMTRREIWYKWKRHVLRIPIIMNMTI